MAYNTHPFISYVTVSISLRRQRDSHHIDNDEFIKQIIKITHFKFKQTPLGHHQHQRNLYIRICRGQSPNDHLVRLYNDMHQQAIDRDHALLTLLNKSPTNAIRWSSSDRKAARVFAAPAKIPFTPIQRASAAHHNWRRPRRLRP